MNSELDNVVSKHMVRFHTVDDGIPESIRVIYEIALVSGFIMDCRLSTHNKKAATGAYYNLFLESHDHPESFNIDDYTQEEIVDSIYRYMLDFIALQGVWDDKSR